MSQATVYNSYASQIEYLRPNIPVLYGLGSRLIQRIKTSTKVKAVSNRPARIPFNALAGAKFRAFNPDGGDMQLGSGDTQTFGSLSCTYFLQAIQWTALADAATNSDEKAIKGYVAENQAKAMKSFLAYEDAVVQGDGSNTLDTVVSTTTGALIVNNASAFQDNQDVDIWTAIGGTFVATVTIASVDQGNNTIWLTGAVPGGVTTGYPILVSGSAGVANSGLYGLRYYQVAGNAGSYMGVQRSAFPGKFSTPYINCNGALTPAAVRGLMGQIKLAMGIDEANTSDLVGHCNVDVEAAWENNSLLVQTIIQNEVSGDRTLDYMKKEPPKTIAGREMLVNERAKPGILDFLALNHWFRIEGQELDNFEVGGQTVFPTYGASGGLAASMITYMWQGLQIGNENARLGGYMNGISIPRYFFGH
jgi:hypothetical protein